MTGNHTFWGLWPVLSVLKAKKGRKRQEFPVPKYNILFTMPLLQ